MPFTTAYISSVNPPQSLPGGMTYLSWLASPSLPAGSIYQVYVDGSLAWFGPKANCTLIVPSGQTSRIVVGSVASTDNPSESFAASFDPAPLRRVTLAWQ